MRALHRMTSIGTAGGPVPSSKTTQIPFHACKKSSSPRAARNCLTFVKLLVRKNKEAIIGFGRGALLWLIGIPHPIILLLAIFMHH
jgi:hypothetical protein